MLDIAWRVFTALVGLGILRSALYRKHWGHGGGILTFLGLALGGVLLTPLWRVPGARPWLVAVTALAVVPWRGIFARLELRSTRRGIDALAEEWGAEVEYDPEAGTFTVTRPADLDRKAWVGNVRTELRSLHPGVSTSETIQKLAFVVRLEEPPGVECALVRGRERPVYHDREWRVDFAAQGQFFAMSMGDLLTEGFRVTGGDLESLASPYGPDDKLGPFDLVLVDDKDAFDAVFSGPMLDALLEIGAGATQIELNITPSSVNLYTGFCGQEEMRARLRFLDRLADRLIEAGDR